MERQNQPPTFHPSVKGGKHLDVCDAQEPFGGSSSSNTDGCAASSTMWDQRREDSAAFSSDQSWTDEDDDEVPGQSHGSDRFTDINTQLDFKDKLPLPEFDSCEEVSGSFVPQEDKAPLSSDDDDGTEEVYAPSGGSDEEYAPSGGSDEEYVPSGGSDEEYIPSGGSEGEDKPRRGSKKEHVPSRDSDEEDVPSGDERISAQPSYTKKNYCYVCGKGVIKFARHLVRHVKKDPEAAEVLALPKCSKERKHALERLRNRGNYNHNQEVLRNKSGELKLKMRRRAMSVSAKTVVHCLYCKGLFNRKNMWNHVYRCTYRKMLNSDTQDKSDALRKLTPLETRFSRELPSGMWNLLSTMKHDEVSLTVQNDFSMLQLTQHLMEKHGSDEQKHEYIRQKLRQMGRVLVALQDKSIMNFEDALTPRNFHKVVETVKNMADADEKKQDNVLKIGRSLEKLCRIVLRGKTDREQERDVRTFLRLCRNKWSELVSQSEGSGKRSSTVTFMHDLQTFYRYLEKKSSSASGDLKTQEDTQVYGSLCRVTLTQVFVLNKGEAMVSKMTLKSFKERDAAAQTLSKHFIRINIKRKAGQSVAVLLTTDLVRALKLLIKKRRKCGVHEDNPFVFAKPDFSASSFYNGENCLTVFSNLCRAKYPQDLRSVHHQEHRARVFQILNLENSELHDLAKLLGHDIRADRDHYRSPEAAVELAKISKLLLAMEKGSLERYSGKSLDEIEIKDELEPDVEQDGAKKGGAEDDNKESEEDSASHQQDGEEEQRHKRLSPVEDALEHIRSESDKHFLQEKFISSSKGRGVFTREPIEKSSFVVEYRGEMSALKESRRKKSDCLNDYVFDFSWDGTNWRVDATEEDGSLGRLVNDDHRNPNCVMRKVDCEGRPHLCLFTRRNIYEGEEITYNYGDSSYDWRSNIFCDDRRSSFTRITRQKAPNTPTSTSSKWPQHNDSDDDDVEDEEEADSSLDEASDKEHTICPKNRNYCYVCGKGYAKISRHLFTHRYEEAEIAQVFAMRQTSNERKKLLHKLRNRGNYKHNQEVLKTQCGELKLSRRLPNVSVTSKSFAACIYCKGMYGRKDMWRHMKVCTLKKVSTPPSCRNKILTFVADSGLADSQELPAEVNKVLKKLKKDEVRSAVLSDSYIMHLAHCLCLMTTKNESADFINQNLRLVGRLLINLREKSINSMEEAFKPENFSKLVEGVREIAGFNKETKTCSKPSLILRLGNLIKKMSNIRYGKTLKDDASKETVKDAETFVKLCAEEWTKGSSTQAKINKPPTVLFTRDVQIFYKCMEKTMASAVKSLTLYESPQVYTALLRVTIALVSLFNRRAFEVSKLTLQAFKEREAVELPADAAATAAAGPQSQFEQILSKRNMRFNIMGKIKRNVEKKVVLTLTPELLTATELLVSKRKTCGVHDRNPFLFARPVAIITSFYREQTCIATFASRCKAKSEESLRSVFFRKHIARIFQILDLTNEQLDELAKVLGCDIQTVREHYRTPEAAGDIAKISELLAAMEDGSLEKFEGKSFEEIEIPDEVEPDVEQDNPEDPEEPEAVEEEDEDAEGSVKLSEALLLLPERKKRGQRKKKKKSESEEPEPEPEPNDKKSDTEKSENKTPEETLSCNFSDNEDMGFDMDVFDDDEDDVRNVENDGENDSNGSGATAERTEVKETTEQEEQEEQEDENDIGDGGEQDNDTDCEDDVAMDDDDGEKHEEEKDEERGEEQTDRMEVESGVSSDTVDTEKKNRLLAIMRGMKEVKIIIRKLDMNLQPPIHITRLPSVFNKRPKRDNSRQRQTSSSPTNVPDKGVHMFCSNCKKSMMKGHTAFQKKGFTDVFCSKNCLFEKFPINKPNTKTCHYCHKAITQLLDLIMAVVDTKGTMKDFCNLTCVTCFKTNSSPTQTPPPPPPPLCSVCNKSCTTTVELTLQDVVHKFCSDSCLEVYCRDNMPACDNCSSFCHKQPLTLKLEEEMKTICSQKCLEEFKEVRKHHKHHKRHKAQRFWFKPRANECISLYMLCA